MMRIPKRLSLFLDVADSPLKPQPNRNKSTFGASKGTRSKLNIKIRKCKLPKDFFASHTNSNARVDGLMKWNNTDRDQEFLQDQNETPKFSESQHKLELFRSAKTLLENKNKILPYSVLRQRKRDTDNPLRELSTGLRITRKYSSKQEIRQMSKIEGWRVEDRRSESYQSNWESPKRLPPLIINQTFLKVSRRK